METKTKELFKFQLEMLVKELDYLNSSIDKIDAITQSIKYWTIGIWGGALSLSLSTKEDGGLFEGQHVITAIIPFLFWLVDAWYRRIQRMFIYRKRQISDFLNSNQLKDSFSSGELIGFSLMKMKLSKKKDFNDESEKKAFVEYTSIWKTLFFRSVCIFYLGLIVFSIIVGLYIPFINSHPH